MGHGLCRYYRKRTSVKSCILRALILLRNLKKDILQFLLAQESCYFGDIHEELPIAKATVSQHLKELKDAGLIQGEIEAPKVRYCINKENWELARRMFADFFGQTVCKKGSCCG